MSAGIAGKARLHGSLLEHPYAVPSFKAILIGAAGNWLQWKVW